MKKILAITIMLLLSNKAFSDGNELLSQCNAAINFMDYPSQSHEDNDLFSMAFCLGLMQGMTNLNRIYEIQLNKRALFCTPDGINNGQAARIVVKYLKEHPEMLHEHKIHLIVRAFQGAYPCK